MRRSAPFILLLMLATAFSGLAATDPAPPTLLGAGTETGGWVALAYPDTRPPIPGSDSPRPPIEQLYFLPTDTPPGALYRAMSLPETPDAMAASGSRVVLLYRPTTLHPKQGTPGWMVRALTVFDQPDPLPPIFDPPGRLEVLPALLTNGDVIGFTGVPGGGVAALIRPIADATGEPIGGNHQLRAMVGGQWRAVSLPATIPATAQCRLFPSSDGVLMLIPDQDDPSRPALWRGVFPRVIDRSDSEIKPDWRRERISLDDIDGPSAPLIVVTGDYLLSATRDDAGAVRLTLHLPDSATQLATLEGVPDDFALTRVGDTAALVYLSDDPLPQIMTAVVHTSTGEILHQGPHVKVAPLTNDDLRFLGFVLALALMTAMVFVLRPQAAARAEVNLPPGTALASPERRLVAGLIDFTIPLLVVVQVWGVGVVDVLLAPITAQRADEFWPFAVTSIAFFGHTTLSEWLFAGRTPGKAIARVRVVSIIGERLTLWQSVCRNTIKLVCPPLLILIFVDPRRRHPGDVIAGAVVVTKAAGSQPPGDGDGDDRDDRGDGDDGPGRTNEAPVSDG